MSHFSTIRTKVKEKDALLEALLILGYHATVEPKELVVTGRHAKNHPTVHTDIQIKEDIGFFLNPTTMCYELVADKQTWAESVPVERFLDKLNQQYARMLIHNKIKKEGFQVAEEWEMDDNSIELTVTRWN